MNQQQRLNVFRAQTKNVRELNSAWAQLKRTIHAQLLHRNDKAVEVNTRLLALTYCAWVEALFSKLIHTPHGFDLEEIEQIKAESRSNGVTAGWRKSVSLALRHVPSARSGHLANVAQTLNRLVDAYIESPSILRNKIGHGQVRIALNRENTDINDELTREISRLNIVVLDRHKAACQGLADIVETIIESPQKGIMRDYWTLTQKITDNLANTAAYTLEKKVEQLRVKAAHGNRIRGAGRDGSDKRHA